MPTDTPLTVNDAARRLGVSPDQVRALIHSGRLQAVNLRVARCSHAEVSAVADLLRRLGDPGEPGPVRTELALAVLDWAYGMTSGYPLRWFNPDHWIEPGFLPRIGVTAPGPRDVAWTLELVLRGLGYYVSAVEGTATEFRADVQAAIDGRAAALDRQVERLEAEVAAIVRRSEAARARGADAALLPPEHLAERVMKYERHLHGLLTSTLHELERLQGRRAGALVALPAVADVHLTVTAGSG
jgi:excisionase family DNA binding protein